MIADDLIRTIREVGNDRPPPLNMLVQARLAERASRHRLTPRELQVLELIAEGMRDKEVAAAMSVSHETVHMHVKHILAKLGVRDRTAAVRTATRHGIIHMA
jgi:DNA-binding NarL/FixJ family response regulator